MGNQKPIFTNKRFRINYFRLAVLVLVVLFLVGIVYIVVMAYNDRNKPWGEKKNLFKPVAMIKNPGEIAFQGKDDIIILCMGLDENRDDRGIAHHKGSRTDTIFVVHLDKKAQRIGILSIPRDTWVEISETYGQNKINSAYSLKFLDEYEKNGHDYDKSKLAGIQQARETIEKFLGLKTDYFVLLKMGAAVDMVDAIGGVTLDVEKDMDYDDNWGNLHIHLKKGVQHLSGKDAIGYGRFRHDEEGDWGRMRRQQQVINALVNELKKPSNILRIDKIAKVIKNNVQTDIDLLELIDLAQVYKNFSKENMIKGIITGTDDTSSDGAAIIIPNLDERDRLVSRIISDPAMLRPSQLEVQVLNGCGVDGLANEVSDLLKRCGYKVVDVGNAGEGTVDKSYIIDNYINPIGAETLLNDLSKTDLKVMHKSAKKGETAPDFTIVLGKDYAGPRTESTSNNSPQLPPLEPEEPEIKPEESANPLLDTEKTD